MLDDQKPDPASFKKELLSTPFEENRVPKKAPGGKSKLPFLLSLVSLALCVLLLFLLVQLNNKLTTREQELGEQIANLTELIETVEADLEDGIEATHQKINTVSDDVAQVQKTVGLTRNQIASNRAMAQEIRQKQEEDVENLARQLTVKADSEQVSTLEQESDTKFQEIDQKIEVVQEDVKESRAELEKTYKELLDIGLKVTEHGRLIATTSEGVEELRKKGERDYVQFDITKKRRTSIAGIGLELRKADVKNARADLRLYYDDKRFDRNKIYVNTPLGFIVGPDRIPYEFVINEVVKDRITGYISVPLGTVQNKLQLQRSSNQ